jgi:hypothetical protein
LVLAATYPMGRVIGVELSTQLCDLARQNLEVAGRRLRCSEVELINQDATNYPIPPDATLFYFANPFAGSILATVLENIRWFGRGASPPHLSDMLFPLGVFRLNWDYVSSALGSSVEKVGEEMRQEVHEATAPDEKDAKPTAE